MTELLIRRLHPDAHVPAGAYEGDVLDAREVEPRVARIGAGGEVCVGMKAADEEVGHTR